jgi:hypothetical protein
VPTVWGKRARRGGGALVARVCTTSLPADPNGGRSPIFRDRARFSANRDKLNRQTPEIERLVTYRKQRIALSSNRQKIRFSKTEKLSSPASFLEGAAVTRLQYLRAFPTGLARRGGLAQSVFCEGFGVHKHISNRFWLTNRIRRNSLKTNHRPISNRF